MVGFARIAEIHAVSVFTVLRADHLVVNDVAVRAAAIVVAVRIIIIDVRVLHTGFGEIPTVAHRVVVVGVVEIAVVVVLSARDNNLIVREAGQVGIVEIVAVVVSIDDTVAVDMDIGIVSASTSTGTVEVKAIVATVKLVVQQVDAVADRTAVIESIVAACSVGLHNAAVHNHILAFSGHVHTASTLFAVKGQLDKAEITGSVQHCSIAAVSLEHNIGRIAGGGGDGQGVPCGKAVDHAKREGTVGAGFHPQRDRTVNTTCGYAGNGICQSGEIGGLATHSVEAMVHGVAGVEIEH